MVSISWECRNETSHTGGSKEIKNNSQSPVSIWSAPLGSAEECSSHGSLLALCADVPLTLPISHDSLHCGCPSSLLRRISLTGLGAPQIQGDLIFIMMQRSPFQIRADRRGRAGGTPMYLSGNTTETLKYFCQIGKDGEQMK